MQTSKLTVLCVDDQPTDRMLMKDLFETHQFEVLTAGDWLGAKDLLHANNVDVVVLDYRLVRSNAVDVAIEVRKSRPRVPIMLLSGFLADVPEYFKRAVDGCVSKSSPLNEWVENLRMLVTGDGTSRGSRAGAV